MDLLLQIAGIAGGVGLLFLASLALDFSGRPVPNGRSRRRLILAENDGESAGLPLNRKPASRATGNVTSSHLENRSIMQASGHRRGPGPRPDRQGYRQGAGIGQGRLPRGAMGGPLL